MYERSRICSGVCLWKFLEALEIALSLGKLRFCGQLAAQRVSFRQLLAGFGNLDLIVYAKPHFGGPQQVIEYLGRYTHRMAISNQRLLNIDNRQVTLEYKDHRSAGRHKSRRMTVSADECIRHFLLHTLPPGFQRSRHYGLLFSRNRKSTLAYCRSLLEPVADLLPSAQYFAECVGAATPLVTLCPVCQVGQMSGSVSCRRSATQHEWTPHDRAKPWPSPAAMPEVCSIVSKGPGFLLIQSPHFALC